MYQNEIREREAEAESVLLSALTPTQAQQYRERRCFDVGVNGHTYCICLGQSYNVYRGGYRYCAIPCAEMPLQYSMLAQFLMLTTNEARFLEIANRSEDYREGL